MELSKDEILRHDKEIFQFYIPEWKEGKNFISPLRDETTPSAAIYKNGGGNWYYKDFGSGDHISPIDFVMAKYSLTFPEALKQINQDLNLGLNGKTFFDNEIKYSTDLKEHEFKYLQQYGISKDICKKLNVVSIQEYTIESKGKPFTIKSSQSDFILAYKIGEKTFKTYRPLNEKYKFSWLGVKPPNYVFGYSELPEKGENVFITGGEKDVLSLLSHNYPAICTSSESVPPAPELIQDLKSRFKNVIVLYDLDKTGKEQSEKICSRFDIKSMALPEELYTKGIGKDVSDFFKASYTFDHTDFIQADTFDNILKEVLQTNTMVSVTETVTEDPLLTRLESLCFNSEIEVPEPIPVISIEGNIISTAGNITVFKGQSKAGKSGNLNGIIGGILAMEGSITDTLGYEVKRNTESKLVLHVDTEQSSYNHFKSIKNILKRCGRDKEPVWFKSLLLRELAIKERKKAIELYIEKYATQFNGVHTLIIDGIADFVNSVNDEQECNEVIHFFEKLAIKYGCPVITIIHLNPSSETKGRGHLDSQLERKAESILNIKKDKDTEISTIEGVYFRNAGSTPILQFRYDQEKGYHVSCGIKQIISRKEVKNSGLTKLANEIFIESEARLSSTEIIEAIQEIDLIKDSAAAKKLKELKNGGYLLKEPGKRGKFYLNPNM